MIKLDIADFPAPYNNINGVKNMPISIYDIARAGMTIGYPKLRNAILDAGLSRFIELFFRANNYLSKENSFYKLNTLFDTLDSSEQKTISYFYGQSFTKLFAERYLDCTQVDNFVNHKGSITFQNNGQTYIPKTQLYNTKKKPKEPDLIGIRGSDYHILEAKGYSSGFKKSEFQHAINQVSIVNSVNGQQPTTKTACYFDLSKNPFLGTIKDPDGLQSSINVEFNKSKFIQDYYSIFNPKLFKRRYYYLLRLNDFEFAGWFIRTRPFLNSVFFGVDMEVFTQIIENRNVEFTRKFYDLSSQMDYISIGNDGIILLNTRQRKFNISLKRINL